jgi:transcriptional regulator
MKRFISQDGETLSVSNFPIKVNGQECQEIDLTEEELLKVSSGKYTYIFKNKKLEFTEIVKEKTAEEIEKENLKAKLEAGTATDSDIKEALKILL